MNEYSGLMCIVNLYNFINSNLIKSDTVFKRNDDFIEITQGGKWIMLPKFLDEVMLIPKSFRVGYLPKSELIKLYDSLSFIVDKKGKVPGYFTNSFISPAKFGFKIYSKYPYDGNPGAKFIQEFKFNIRHKWYHRLYYKLK